MQQPTRQNFYESGGGEEEGELQPAAAASCMAAAASRPQQQPAGSATPASWGHHCHRNTDSLFVHILEQDLSPSELLRQLHCCCRWPAATTFFAGGGVNKTSK